MNGKLVLKFLVTAGSIGLTMKDFSMAFLKVIINYFCSPGNSRLKIN